MKQIPVMMALASLLTSTTAMAQAHDRAPEDLASSRELRHDKKEAWTYIKPGLNLSHIDAVQIVPTTVYRGADAQFEDVSEPDREKFAAILTEALRTEMAKSFKLVSAPTANALRIKATIIGATKTTGGVGTVSSVMPIGIVTNAIKSVTGKKGTFSGSVLLAVEVFDSKTGELLAAAVRREAPDALDIGATISTSDTVKSVANAFAKKLRERLEDAKSHQP